MAFMEHGGFRLSYEDGGGDAPALLFLHGAGGNHLSWWQQVPVFAEEYRCVTLDQRGFGQSPETTGRFARSSRSGPFSTRRSPA